MPSLDGKRALIVGRGHPYAEAFRAALGERGMAVSVVDPAATPVIESTVDVLVTCPPAIAYRAAVAETIAAALLPAEAWAARFASVLRSQGRPGVIVHVTGLAGLGGWPGWEAAGAAYAAINSIARATAVDLARHGIRVNALVAGVDEQFAGDIAVATGRPLAAILERIPARRFMPESALTNALLYLVHPSSSYVSGETLTVDGGWDVWGRLAAVAS